MRRTQICFNENEWNSLRFLATRKKKTVSELIRQAVTRVYFSAHEQDIEGALDAIAGLWKDRAIKTDTYVRSLRKGKRRLP